MLYRHCEPEIRAWNLAALIDDLRRSIKNGEEYGVKPTENQLKLMEQYKLQHLWAMEDCQA